MQQGDSTHAAVELKAYLVDVPNSTPAKNLLAQIETPIETLYPTDNFAVQLGRDETLSSLAGVYLGDVLGFYGLARYNNIENPSRVVVGQSIRIPRTPQTLAAQAVRVIYAAAKSKRDAPRPLHRRLRLRVPRYRATRGPPFARPSALDVSTRLSGKRKPTESTRMRRRQSSLRPLMPAMQKS